MQSIQTIGQPLLCIAQATIAEFALNALPLMNILHAINFWYIMSGKMTPQVCLCLCPSLSKLDVCANADTLDYF